MKKLYGSMKAKWIAFILLLVCTSAAFLCGLGSYWGPNYRAFSDGGEHLIRSVYNSALLEQNDRILDQYVKYVGSLDAWGDYLPPWVPEQAGITVDDGYRFVLTDANTELIGTYNGGAGGVLLADAQSTRWISYFDLDRQLRDEKIIITGYLYDTWQNSRYDFQVGLIRLVAAYMGGGALIVLLILFSAAALTLLVFLLRAAGHREGSDTIVLNRIDRLPFDLYTLILLVLALFYSLLFRSTEMRALGLLLFLVFGLLWLLSFAARVKTEKWWENSYCWKYSRPGTNFLKKLGRSLRDLFRSLPLVWRTFLVTAGLFLLNLIVFLCNMNHTGWFLIFFLFESVILLPIVLVMSVSLERLRKSCEKLADGDLSHQADTGFFFWEFRKFAETINRLGSGLSKAVEERMKSERFKTELITNVSHDLKTPLTSIINYVNLLKKEEPESETVREYVEVIDRQSAKLKKLTSDLLEASKASAGTLPVKLEPCEVGVLLEQTVGEYQEKMKAQNLELVLDQPEEPVWIMADGEHLWRVFENLLGNILHYSLEQTRVYLSLRHDGQSVSIVFRNISRDPLNVPGDELMERFVRGDRSRNSEGSGLGLSIANSLMTLQNGKMELVIDGDLFKVVLTFPEIDQNKEDQ